MTSPIRVIYVEDEPSVRAMLPRVLALAGIEVSAVYQSGEELLEKKDMAEYRNVDVLLFDVQLPGITGLELAAELRAQGEKRPIVAVSAWPLPREQNLAEIGVEYLQKPFDFGDLEETIKSLARGHASDEKRA